MNALKRQLRRSKIFCGDSRQTANENRFHAVADNPRSLAASYIRAKEPLLKLAEVAADGPYLLTFRELGRQPGGPALEGWRLPPLQHASKRKCPELSHMWNGPPMRGLFNRFPTGTVRSYVRPLGTAPPLASMKFAKRGLITFTRFSLG
jgi:hypothetical protein